MARDTEAARQARLEAEAEAEFEHEVARDARIAASHGIPEKKPRGILGFMVRFNGGQWINSFLPHRWVRKD